MVCGFDQVQSRPVSEFLKRGFKKVERGELIARAGQKQHWNVDTRKMISSLRIRAAGKVQRKREQHQSFYIFKGLFALGGRCHSTAEGVAPGEQCQIRHCVLSHFYGAPDRFDARRGRISGGPVL